MSNITSDTITGSMSSGKNVSGSIKEVDTAKGSLIFNSDTKYKIGYDDSKIKLSGTDGSESFVDDLTIGDVHDICTF